MNKIIIVVVVILSLLLGSVFFLSQIYQKNLREICEDVDLKYSGQARCYKIEEGRVIIYEIERVGIESYVNKFPKDCYKLARWYVMSARLNRWRL